MIYLTEAMFSSGQPVCQGEVVIWMKKYAPPAVIAALAGGDYRVSAVDGRHLIVGHSETGHHHVIEAVRDVPFSTAAQTLIDAANDTYVELRLFEDCQLRHLREHDTHDALVFPPGEYIRRVREESVPEGWRRVAD